MSKYAKKNLFTKVREMENEISRIEDIVLVLNQDIAALESLKNWFAVKPVLEANQTSRAHQIIANRTIISPEVKFKKEDINLAIENAKSFVVKHDWHAALGIDFSDTDIEVKMPFDSCLFEFIYSGRCVSIWALNDENTPFGISCLPFIQIGDVWFLAPKEAVDKDPVFSMSYEQILSICVALDSGVAEQTIIKAPEKINKKRLKFGRKLIKDHYLVDLSQKFKTTKQSIKTEDITQRKRMHFRRGHWRHLPQKKTWINWMLVGDPCLGFIDKGYAI